MTNAPSEPAGRVPDSAHDVIVGRIVGAWGLDGELKVERLTDSPERFSPGKTVHLRGRPERVLRSRTLKGGLRVKLESVNDRTQAESLLGSLLTVPLSEVPRLPDGAYYHFQIIDIRVWTEDGRYLGQVKDVLQTGGRDVYVVRGEGKSEVLLPAVPHVVLDVDPEEGKMVVRIPEGLL